MEYKIFKNRFNNYINYDFVDDIKEQFNLNEITAKLLYQKGFTTFGEIEEFLYPKEDDLINPFLFKDMKNLIARIEKVILNNEKVIIYTDYDCDGVCGGVILYKALIALNINCDIKTPNRFTQGYGINSDDIDEIYKQGYNLIITVDNGITAVDEAEKILSYGIDMIITDHHTCPDILPNAYAIINPKNPNDTYPFKELCGAGVAFKIACALKKYFTSNIELNELISLASIATITDIVPLIGENRTIAHLGIEQIRKTKNAGLLALMNVSGLEKSKINSGNLGFQIGPRINAAGRLETANHAINLLLEDNIKKAEQYAKYLNEANDERKKIEEKIIQRAFEIIENNEKIKNSNIVFISDKDFNEGVMGIAAGVIAERINHPTIIISLKNGIGKASCRSIPGFNIFNALNDSNELFIKFGGHTQAAGFSIKEENIPLLIKRVNEYANKNKISALLYKRKYYDQTIGPSALTIKTAAELNIFAPFGYSNAKTVFILKNIFIRNVRRIGQNNEHLKFSVSYKGNYYDAIAFKMGHLINEYDFNSESYDILFSLNINSYGGVDKLQLEIKDIDKNYDANTNYAKSLYDNFKYFFNKETFLLSNQNNILNTHIETVLDNNYDLYIIYNADTLNRVIKYMKYKNIACNIGYGSISINPNKKNILVNPIDRKCISTAENIIILDKSIYHDYEKELYENNNNITFLYKINSYPVWRITREFMLFVYRKLKILPVVGNNINKLIDNMNSESDIPINYFVLRTALDVMQELELLSYTIEKNEININFNKINSQKDINKSKIMVKLQGKALKH